MSTKRDMLREAMLEEIQNCVSLARDDVVSFQPSMSTSQTVCVVLEIVLGWMRFEENGGNGMAGIIIDLDHEADNAYTSKNKENWDYWWSDDDTGYRRRFLEICSADGRQMVENSRRDK